MGKYDSTRTRVTPVFDALYQRDPSGRKWLGQLLRLPMGGARSTVAGEPGDITTCGWGTEEVSLRAPESLLRHLVTNLPKKPPTDLGTNDEGTRAKRQALLDGDPDTIGEATSLLSQAEIPAIGWCVFEGSTRPDVYIETDTHIVVVEGKRTESGPDRRTTWMPVRSQLLRHLDCARERCGGAKRVVGFYLVEGTTADDPQSTEVPAVWTRAAEEIQRQAVVDGSLPHRSPAERAEIVGGFLGVATWQQVCAELGVDWPTAGRAESIADPYRFALVELSAPQQAADGIGDGIKKALRRHPERREAQVRVVVESMVLDDVDLIVLPGWSLVGRAPPAWLLDRSRGRTIVVEMMNPEDGGGGKTDGSAWSFVLQDGRCVFEGVRQLLASSGEAWVKNEFTPDARATAHAWLHQRRWRLPADDGLAMLALCGEINIVHNTADGESLTPTDLALDAVSLIVNPSHTRMQPQGSREQRARLSRTALVVVTANTHEAGYAADRASRTTAEIYWRGEPVRLDDASVCWSADRSVRAQRIWLDDRSSAGQGTPIVLGEIGRARLRGSAS